MNLTSIMNNLVRVGMLLSNSPGNGRDVRKLAARRNKQAAENGRGSLPASASTAPRAGPRRRVSRYPSGRKYAPHTRTTATASYCQWDGRSSARFGPLRTLPVSYKTRPVYLLGEKPKWAMKLA